VKDKQSHSNVPNPNRRAACTDLLAVSAGLLGALMIMAGAAAVPYSLFMHSWMHAPPRFVVYVLLLALIPAALGTWLFRVADRRCKRIELLEAQAKR
jgi:divalent metal cation (Fe/Co/Zn/Cd) transporter